MGAVKFVFELIELSMKQILYFFISMTLLPGLSYSQGNGRCTPKGDQTTYGTNNVWIGYVYDKSDFTTYHGYVTEGSSSSPDFDQNFGGKNVNYSTNGCTVKTETFSVRYKLRKTFSSGSYRFTVGGDDGYRLSLDGGSTWVINGWTDQSYTERTAMVSLDGNYNLVLEYYENSDANRISFSVEQVCGTADDTNIYGSNNIWNGYVYEGRNFQIYKGMVHEGSALNPDFDQSFGGSNVSYATSSCPVQTENFSVRYRLSKDFAAGSYEFTVGADDGYRLSIDGGATWIINKWTDHSYSTTKYSASLSGSQNLVLEYYENGGNNRVSFSMRTLMILPVTLQSFTARERSESVELNWSLSQDSNPDKFVIEKSNDGISFSPIGNNPSKENGSTQYRFIDPTPFEGLAYYRLKITDQNGMVTYSFAISVRNVNSTPNKVSVFPTIVTGNSFSIKSKTNIRNAEITISGINGKVMSKQKIGNISAEQPFPVSLGNSSLGKGIYLVSISGGDYAYSTSKIIIQ